MSDTMSHDILMPLSPGCATENSTFCTLLASLKAEHLLLFCDAPGQAKKIFSLGVG